MLDWFDWADMVTHLLQIVRERKEEMTGRGGKREDATWGEGGRVSECVRRAETWMEGQK